MRWYHDLIANEIFFMDRWFAGKFDLLHHSLVLVPVVVLVLLHVDKGRLELEVKQFCVIVLIHACHNHTNFVVYIYY